MCAVFISSMVFFTLGVINAYTLTLLDKQINVAEGGSYFQRVADSDLVISKCSAKFTQEHPGDLFSNEIVIGLNLEGTDAVFPEDFQDSLNLKSRLHSLGFGFCGFKVEKVSLQDPEDWTIEATSNDTIYKAAFHVGVYESVEQHSVKELTLGQSTYIDCGDMVSPTYCFLYNPKGEVVYRGTICSYHISAVAIEDIGMWKCIVGATRYMEPMEFTIELTTKDSIQPEKWVNETKDYMFLGCNIKDCCKIITPDHCLMTSPIGERILISPGSASSRYTSFYTNLQQNICAIEIRKPLLDTEKGLWSCEIADRGLFLQVGETTSAKDMTFSSSTVTELDETFQVNCKIPYRNSYCFVTSPTGKRYEPKDMMRPELGECSTEIKNADITHNGTWTCSFFRDEDVVAVEKKIEVSVRNAMKCSLDVSAVIGGSTTLYCNTGRAPLEYCWFSSPAGKTYQMKRGVETSEVSYVGEGLEFGHCGIKIYNPQDEDIGSWVCTMKIGSSESKYTIILDLKAANLSLGASLGISFGALAILLAVIGGFLYKRYRKPSRLSVSDSGSDTVIMSEISSLQQNRPEQRQYTF